jgi:hypothetical protein
MVEDSELRTLNTGHDINDELKTVNLMLGKGMRQIMACHSQDNQESEQVIGQVLSEIEALSWSNRYQTTSGSVYFVSNDGVTVRYLPHESSWARFESASVTIGYAPEALIPQIAEIKEAASLGTGQIVKTDDAMIEENQHGNETMLVIGGLSQSPMLGLHPIQIRPGDDLIQISANADFVVAVVKASRSENGPPTLSWHIGDLITSVQNG